MPIPLGIFATAGAGGAAGPAYELISTQILGSSTSTITFSSIPQTYKHLQLRTSAKAVGYNGYGQVRFNGDTSTNYRYHALSGNGSGVSSFTASTTTFISIPDWVWRTPSSFNASVIDIIDYASSSKNTTIKVLNGRNSFDDGNPTVALSSGFWNNTAAVSSMTIFLEGSGSFDVASRFSLYGIKG